MGNCNGCCHEENPAVPVEVTAWHRDAESEDEASPEAPVPTITIVPASPRADASPSKLSRLQNMDVLEVDKEILRGISLSASLHSGGKLWRKSPLDMPEQEREKLWTRSAPVENFDIFLSHTWLTPGRHKVVSLLFQSGWKFALCCWLLSIIIADILIIQDVLPMPFRTEVEMFCFKGEVHFFFWPMLAGFLGTWMGLLLSPYVNSLSKPKMCFLDVVSIHQTDQELMERGIYGLGGFLSVAKELRVLWSTPYLSRLWCVFELAAYRSANPNGKISLKPLFVERGMMGLMLGTYFAACLFWLGLVFNISQGQAFSLLELLALTPVFVIVHFLRWNIREKFKLLSDLKDFDLEKAFCRTAFDRSFVHSAIVKWYGSKEAFMRYVRGPLREELMLQGATYVPFGYFMMLSSATFAASMNHVSAMMKAQATFECIASEFLGSALGFYVFWFLFMLKICLWLTEHFAMPWWRGRLVNWLQSFVLFLVFVALYTVGFITSRFAYRHSLSGALLWMSFSFICCTMSFCIPRCVNTLKRAVAGAL